MPPEMSPVFTVIVINAIIIYSLERFWVSFWKFSMGYREEHFASEGVDVLIVWNKNIIFV